MGYILSKITLSVDDGSASDLRIAELAKKYNVDCVFYWPVEWVSLAFENGYIPLTIEEAGKIAGEFEIGSHTVTHRHLTKLSQAEAEFEIYDSKLRLTKLFDQPIKKFCPPRGYTNPQLTKYTMQYYDSQRLTKGSGLVHIHPNSGANGNVAWQDYFRMIEGRGENNGNIELWGHSWEWDNFNMWESIEQFLKEHDARSRTVA